ncbi:MAG: VOC family protein [Bryobacter sp.]|nr:VOC family protein [Bryobacter sp.]
MRLGEFSISLAVKDIKKSLAFYEKLGFEVMDGDVKQKWVMLQNGQAKIGLFQDMFEDNVITFNPPDVREIEDQLKAQGVKLVKASEGEEGPAHIVVKDPDGNSILLDQF